MNIYVGNISFNAAENNLRDLFEEFGEVVSVKLIIDHNSGRSKGFGFVEMENNEDGLKAIESLNGSEFMERNLIVKQAEDRDKSKGGGGFNRGTGGGGFNRGGGGGGGFNRGGGGGGFNKGGSGGGFNKDRRSGGGGFNKDRGGNRDFNKGGGGGGYSKNFNKDYDSY